MNTTFSYDHYYLQDEIESNVKALSEKFPEIFSYEYLLETQDKHHVIAVTLTNKATGAACDKPAFYIDGNTHAGEVTGMMAAMHTMDALATNYGSDERVTFILDNMAVYIIPCVSPDGSQTYLTTPYTLRSVNRPYYEHGTGLEGEDVDGDGVIRMMRVPDKYGAWKKDPEKKDMMVRREPDDVAGDFYSIYTEGVMEEFDGINVTVNKEKWGRDFNRNYPFGWFPEYRQPGAGEYPLSNPENKAIVQFILSHPNIGSVATNHTSGGILLTVPGTYPEKKAPGADMKIMNAIGEMGTKATGYKHINIFDSFTVDQDNYSSGAFDDYCYETQGIYAITLELWNLDERCGVKHFWEADPKVDTTAEDFEKRMAWINENAEESDFVSWKEFDHPQFGKVEIGGFNYKFTVQNPPKKFLAEECGKITAFMLRWAAAMPKLVIDSFTVTEIGDDVYKAEAVVSNAGFLPTYLSENAKKLGTAKPVQVSIDAENFVSCKQTQDIGDLSSFALCNTAEHFYGNISTLTCDPISKKVTWIFKGKKPELTVTAWNQKAGKVSMTVKV